MITYRKQEAHRLRELLLACLFAIGIAVSAAPGALAAPVQGSPPSEAKAGSIVQDVACRWRRVCDWRGCRSVRRCSRGSCRSGRVCDRRGCRTVRRCW